MKLKSLRQNFHSRNHHVYHCQLRVLDTDPELQAFVTSLLLHVLQDFQTWKVSISGEAFFQVRKDKNHPFIVDIGKLQVEVLGTSFNVMTDTYNDEIRISLLEGKVALYEKGQSSKSAKILMPNQEAKYSPSNGEIMISPIRMDNVMSWITGKFSFEDNTLAEIGEELERAFHVKIHIENEAIRKKTFNATFEDKETLDEILSILQISAKYKMEKKRGEIYIY